ncbi:MAG TPA: AAA family ATPase [Gemmatimonadaceae bacterium]
MDEIRRRMWPTRVTRITDRIVEMVDRWVQWADGEFYQEEQPYEPVRVTPSSSRLQQAPTQGEMQNIEDLRHSIIDAPALAPVEVPFNLRPGEEAYLKAQKAIWREMRNAPGVLHGSLTVVEIGQFYITNQRVIVAGSASETSLALSELEGGTVSDGMLLLLRVGDLDPYIELSSPALLDIAVLLIERVRRGGRPLREYLGGEPAPLSPHRATPSRPSRAMVPPVPAVPPPTVDELLAKLDKLVGLTSVKSEIHTLVNVARIREMRKKEGLKTPASSYHMVFVGPPGTGKTTVARLLSQIFQALGLLTKGHLVEVDRTELVAGFVGQTAIKTDACVKQALGGVLFIDEAYSLAAGGDQDFGREAIETLIKLMEDNRDDLVVIAAGYRDRMHDFIESNPGLRSRFTRFIDFPDYTPDELTMIFTRLAQEEGYKLDSGVLDLVRRRMSDAYNTRTDTFGNGRMVRNLFEQSLTRQANRLAVANPSRDDLCTLVQKDIEG